MYSMLIVEDERWEREGLLGFLEWEKMGVSVSGTAVDGIDGYEKALELRPDIIVTDIRMPGMNGLEMAKKIRVELPDVRIVILSGYSDFEYTREAIGVEADDYVLKPVEEEDMRATMLRVIAKCEQLQARLHEEAGRREKLRTDGKIIVEKLMLDLFSRRSGSAETSQMLLEREGDLRSKRLIVLVVVPRDPVPKDELLRMYGTLGYLLPSEAFPGAATLVLPVDPAEQTATPREAADQILGEWKRHFRQPLIIGMGEPADRLENAEQAYGQALEAARYGVFLEMEGIVTAKMEEEARQQFADDFHSFLSEWKEASRQLRLHVLSLQEDAVFEGLKKMFAFIREHPGVGKPSVAAYLGGLIIELSVTEEERGAGEGCIQELLQMNKLEDMFVYVHDYIGKLFKSLESKRGNKSNHIVEKAIQLIEEKLGSNNLSLTLLAEEVFVSPNHLGSMFKKLTGKTVHQFIMEKRMQSAEDLLGTGKLKVSEAAEQVGISNISYFCSLFKQHCGVSPGEYKDMMLRRQ